ncbi:MAG: TIGR02301 family protein [Pseudomonadota bacterium]
MTLRALICVIAAVLCWISPVAAQRAPVDARENFEARQRDLVSLAGHLGSLHRLQQICGSGYRPELYRNRMQDVVELEVPMGSTRLDMIAAFNSSYRDMSRAYLACGDAARATFETEAQQALRVVERLYAPFR